MEEKSNEQMPSWAVDLQAQIAELIQRVERQDEEEKSKKDFTRFRERHGLTGKENEQTSDKENVQFGDIRKRLGIE